MDNARKRTNKSSSKETGEATKRSRISTATSSSSHILIGLSSRQIIAVTKVIPATHLELFARDYLQLLDTEITNAANKVTTTVYDWSYNVLITWFNREHTKPTVGKMLTLIKQAISDGAIRSTEALIVLSEHADTDLLNSSLISSLAVTLSESEIENFGIGYLNISISQCKSLMRARADDLSATSEGIIRTWCSKQTNKENILHHFCRLLIELNKKHGCIEEDIEALEKRLSDKVYQMESPRILGELPAKTVLSEMSHTLQSYYQRHCRYMNIACWIDMVDQSSLLEMDQFFIHLTTSKSDHMHSQATASKSETVELVKLLECKTAQNKLAKHILIEGEAGGGKSTLCDKLAWDWSWGRNCIQRLDTFTLLFVIRVCDLKEHEKISEHIRRVLCAANETLSAKDMHQCIVGEREKVLFLIDGLDERSIELPQLYELIEGAVFSHSTVLLTSRHGSVGTRKRYCDLILDINRLTDKDISNFIGLYKKGFSVDNLLESQSNVAKIFSTPLLLSLFCVIYPEKIDIKLENTQTESLSILSKGLKRNVKHKYKWRKQDCETALGQMCELAYKSLREGSATIEKKLNEMEEKLGFVKISGKKRYTFTHKLLQEFLAARYVCRKGKDASVDDIIDSVMKVPEVANEQSRRTSMLLVFVCGLMAEHNLNVLLFLSSVLPTLRYDDSDSLSGYVNHQAHLVLQCLAECGDVLSDKLDMNTYKDKYPNKILQQPLTCDASCIRGARLLTTHNRHEVDVQVFVADTGGTLTRHTQTLLHDCMLSARSNRLVICDDSMLDKLFSAPDGVYCGVETLKYLILARCTSSAVSKYNIPPRDALQLSHCKGHDLVELCRQLLCDGVKALYIGEITLSEDEWRRLIEVVREWKGEALTMDGVSVEGSSSSSATLNIQKLQLTRCTPELCWNVIDMCAGSVKEILLKKPQPCSDGSEATLSSVQHTITVDILQIYNCSSSVCIDLLQACRGHIAAVALFDISTADDGSVSSTLTTGYNTLTVSSSSSPTLNTSDISTTDDGSVSSTLTAVSADLQVDKIVLTRCDTHVCMSMLRRYTQCLQGVQLQQLDVNDADVTSLVAAVCHCPNVHTINIYESKELQSIFMLALLDTEKIHTLRELGIDIYCMRDIEVARQLLCAAERVEELYLYNRSTTAGDELSLCRLLCTAGSRLQVVWLFGVSPDGLLAALNDCSEDERGAIMWKKVGLSDLDHNLLEGDWKDRLKILLPSLFEIATSLPC